LKDRLLGCGHGWSTNRHLRRVAGEESRRDPFTATCHEDVGLPQVVSPHLHDGGLIIAHEQVDGAPFRSEEIVEDRDGGRCRFHELRLGPGHR
jgi:hypothetical protein